MEPWVAHPAIKYIKGVSPFLRVNKQSLTSKIFCKNFVFTVHTITLNGHTIDIKGTCLENVKTYKDNEN